jgi:hypothetical protein
LYGFSRGFYWHIFKKNGKENFGVNPTDLRNDFETFWEVSCAPGKGQETFRRIPNSGENGQETFRRIFNGLRKARKLSGGFPTAVKMARKLSDGFSSTLKWLKLFPDVTSYRITSWVNSHYRAIPKSFASEGSLAAIK